MKKILLYIPVVLSLLVLGAHFLRYGSSIGVLAVLLLLALLFLRRPWVARVMQIVLALGTLEWLRTMVEIANTRALLGQPYGRMLVILGIVAAVTLCSALVFQSRTLKAVYGARKSG
jgi:hypothetical protein